MLPVAYALLATVSVPSVEIVICDPVREVSWTAAGTRTPRYLPDTWEFPWIREIVSDTSRRNGSKTRRMLLVRVPWTKDETPSVFVDVPGRGRQKIGTVLREDKPEPHWTAIFPLDAKSVSQPGRIRIGVSDGAWVTTGTWWTDGRRRGDRFPVRFLDPKEIGRNRIRRWQTLRVDLPPAPPDRAWRVLAYGPTGRRMEATGSVKLDNQPELFFFQPANKRDPIRRADLQRRPIVWMRYPSLRLDREASK